MKLMIRKAKGFITLNPMIMEINMGIENFNLLKKKLRNKYPQLTEADLFASSGNENKMFTMVAYKLRKTKRELIKIINAL